MAIIKTGPGMSPGTFRGVIRYISFHNTGAFTMWPVVHFGPTPDAINQLSWVGKRHGDTHKADAGGKTVVDLKLIGIPPGSYIQPGFDVLLGKVNQDKANYFQYQETPGDMAYYTATGTTLINGVDYKGIDVLPEPGNTTGFELGQHS